MAELSPENPLQPMQGRIVVLDLASPFVVVGTLVADDHRYLVLDDADIHDLRDSSTTRELYVLELHRHGLGPNRKRVLVQREDVVGISLLDDVVR
jgi:hypothetical protein